MLFLMINIAEYEKTKLGKTVTIRIFIQTGVNICNRINFMQFDDIYDKIKIEYYIFILKELLNRSNKM
jgi:hypothetical protein